VSRRRTGGRQQTRFCGKVSSPPNDAPRAAEVKTPGAVRRAVVLSLHARSLLSLSLHTRSLLSLSWVCALSWLCTLSALFAFLVEILKVFSSVLRAV